MDQEKDKTKITNARNQREDNILDSTNIKRVIREYYERIYVNKFEDSDQMD